MAKKRRARKEEARGWEARTGFERSMQKLVDIAVLHTALEQGIAENDPEFEELMGKTPTEFAAEAAERLERNGDMPGAVGALTHVLIARQENRTRAADLSRHIR